MKHQLMKALLCLSSLLCIYSSYGQTQYLKANSVANFWLSTVETSNSCQDTKSAFSTLNSQDIVLFNNPNQECSNKTNVSLRLVNLNLDKWIRATCMTFSEQTVCQFNLAPGTYANQTVILPYSTNYMWKVEDSTPQTPTFGKDTLRIEASRFVQNVNITDNNLNMPSPNIAYNIKAGQTISLVSVLGNGSPLSITAGASLGTQNIIFEVYDKSNGGNVKIGEDVLTVIVGPTCTINVESFEPIAFGSTTYNVTVRSNIPAKPYIWELRDAFGTGILRKTGTTSANTSGVVEQISLETIGTGTYNLFFRSANNQYCSGDRRVALLDDRDKCSVTIINPKVLAGLFTATISTSANISGMTWTLQNAKDSVLFTGNSFNPSINLKTLAAGDYTLYAKPNNFCSANYRISWNGSSSIGETRGYLKKYNNVPDYYEIAGIGDYAGVKDAGTGWVVKETRNVMIWQTYVKALSNSPGAKALITFRQDSSSTSKHFSLAFEKGKIKVIQRTLKGGANVVSTEIVTTSESTWLRFERNGNNLLCKASDSPPESDNPVYATVATINNAFAGWNLPFWKGLYVSSGSSTTLASAEFHRFLGGPYTGTTVVADNTPLAPPIIAASNLNPTANASVTFTSNACKSGFLIQYYKNGLPTFQGSTYTVNVSFGDSYRAKCEKGSEKSGFSNTISFTAPTPGPAPSPTLCGITDGLKIGDKTQFGSVFEMKARIFGGKLWLTQSLGTNPESFLVRGVNMLVGDFVKTWTGNDYSCFEGQTTNPGGFPEPTGFTTPAGYTLTTTADGARIYTFGTVTPTPEGGGTTIVSGVIFPNMFQSITPETVNDTFGAEKFMTLSYPSGMVRGTFPKTFNSELGFNLPNWINVLHTDMSLIYKNKEYNVIDDFGYLGSTDIRKHGVQGTDWQLFPWGNFTTALPVERRVETYLGTLVHDFLALDDAGVIQKGFEVAYNTDFGNIVVGGKTQRIYTSVDSEGAGEDGSAGIRKPLLLFKTIFENTIGIVSYMYGTPIQSDLGYNTNGNGYADANGNIPASMINPLFRDSESFNGVPYKLINSRGLAPHGEISHYGESAYGNYNDGVRQLTVFGPNANNEHYLARVVEHNEKNYYAYKKLGGADLVMFQNKSICDRGLNGWKYNDGSRQNGGTKAAFTGYLKRDQVFKSQMASFFSGVHTVEWNRPPLGVNSDSQNGIEEARTILNTEVIFSPTERISALKLRSGAFEFSLYNAEYKLQGETNWRKEKGYELKDTQDNLLVRFMKKGNYMVVFVCDPYNLATKKNLTVRWGSFEKSFTVNDWASCYSDGSTKDYIYAIYNVSVATPGTETGAVIAPTISKNIANPTAGQSVILTSTGCQSNAYVNKWYDSAEGSLLGSGVTYTVNAANGNGYYAKCVGTTASSVASNYIVFNISTIPPPSGSITITEPAKPQYYFSNGHAPSYYDNNINMPAIHQSSTRNVSNYSGKILSGITMQSNYSPTNDLVWLQNDKIKVGINLLRGGQIAWLSTVNATTNLVYNGYDGGFQITMDAYQRKDGYTQGGKFSRKNYSQTLQYDGVTNNPDNPLTSYNTTMGGDFNNNSQSLIAYYPIANGYVVKYRPIFYTIDAEFSEVTIETKYTLQPGASSVRVEYTYHSFRTDSQFNGGGFDGAAAPSCFFVNTLNRYQTYAGSSPWTNAPVEDGQLPIQNNGEQILARNATEKYSVVYNPTTLKTAGVYIPSNNPSEYTRLKQLEVYSGQGPGTEFTNGFTHLDFNHDFGSIITPIPNRSNYTKTIVGYVIATDSPADARAEAYRLKTLLGN